MADYLIDSLHVSYLDYFFNYNQVFADVRQAAFGFIWTKFFV